MDEFLKVLLKDKIKNNSLAIYEVLGKAKKWVISVMSLLYTAWLKLENAKKFDVPLLSVDEMLSLVDQTICLLGQTSNLILYHRR